MNIVPATATLLHGYGIAVVPTMQAVCALDGEGEVVGIAGLARYAHCTWLFSDLRPDVKRPRLFVMGMRRLVPMMEGRVVYAHADPEVEGSVFLLRRMGFEKVYADRDVYVRRG